MKTKSIFIWQIEEIGAPEQIVVRLVEAGFEAAILHSVNLTDWRTASRVMLARAAQAVGLKVYGSSGVYGYDPAQEGRRAAQIVLDYDLDGFIFDAEATFDAQPTPDSNAVHLLMAYKGMTAKPCAWCWWPFYKSPSTGAEWHPLKVLKAAMQHADYGMPMAYWWLGDDAASAAAFLDKVWAQWRVATDKPIIPAGRTYTGDSGTAKPEAVLAFESRARALGAAGVTWWSMQHAIKLPGVWEALSAAPGWQTDEEPEEPVTNKYKTYPMGLYTDKPGWPNPAYGFIIGHAGQGWDKPNEVLKGIEEQAAAEGKPFMLLWDFDAGYYTDFPFDDPTRWPSVADDLPLQRLILPMRDRDCKAVIIRFDDYTARNDLAPSWISKAGQVFMGRVGDWLEKNKPGVKLIIATSDEWIKAHGDNPKSHSMYNWAYEYPSMLIRDAARPLDESYPQDGDKPGPYIGVRLTWEFWLYFDGSLTDLVLYNGALGTLEKFLGLDVPEPPVDVTPPTAPGSLAAVVNEDHSVTLTWTPAQDNVGVVEYILIRGGQQIGVTSGIVTTYTDTPLVGEHSYQVRARDAGGNLSPLSEAVRVTITAESPGSPDLEEVNSKLDAILALLQALFDWLKGIFKGPA